MLKMPNTSILKDGDDYHILHKHSHSTDIVTIDKNGQIYHRNFGGIINNEKDFYDNIGKFTKLEPTRQPPLKNLDKIIEDTDRSEIPEDKVRLLYDLKYHINDNTK
jgi:hypothetical protein